MLQAVQAGHEAVAIMCQQMEDWAAEVGKDCGRKERISYLASLREENEHRPIIVINRSNRLPFSWTCSLQVGKPKRKEGLVLPPQGLEASVEALVGAKLREAYT